MAKKQFNDASPFGSFISSEEEQKDALQTGLEAMGLPVAADPSPTPSKSVRRGRPSRSDEYTTANIVVRKDLYEKFRVIAGKAGCAMKDIFEKSMDKSVQSYERKYGTILLRKSKSSIDKDTIFED
jgi:hypothetical protein